MTAAASSRSTQLSAFSLPLRDSPSENLLLLSFLAAVVTEELQELKEDVNDVQAQGDRRKDIVVDLELLLVTTIVTEHHLRVVDDVEHEHEDAAEAVDQRHGFELHAVDVLRKRETDTEDGQYTKRTEEVRTEACEVRLRRPRINRQACEDHHGHTSSSENDIRVVERGHETHHDAFCAREEPS